MSEEGKNRQSLLLPIMIPVGALAVIGIALFGFSRVLLGITPTAAWITALVAAAGIMAVASFVASRRSVSGGSLLSMVGAVAGVAMLAGGVALFVAKKGEEGPSVELPVVTIVAAEGASTAGYSEETRNVTAPADEPFQILFDNRDGQARHNVVIAASEDTKSDPLFREEPFLGPRKMTWKVEPPLAAGSYIFFCEIHPTVMTGTVEAVVGGGTVVAENFRFDTAEIKLPANTPSKLPFDNKDVGTPHNLSIYADEAYTDAIVRGEPFPGSDMVTYDVPALAAGTYYFKCDVHPTMAGLVTVGPPGGGGGGPQEAQGG